MGCGASTGKEGGEEAAPNFQPVGVRSVDDFFDKCK